jgi:GNAT superfamily N-acetyltransferase
MSTDLALARRLESAHAASGRTCATASEPIGGGWAIFSGSDSPVTQAIGIGMQDPVTDAEIDRLESFYISRGSPPIIDLCSLACPSLVSKLYTRGYRLREITNVLASHPTLSAGPLPSNDFDTVSRIIARGFAPTDEAAAAMRVTMNEFVHKGEPFLAECDGQPAAGALLFTHENVATFAGDATLEFARGRGLQQLLIKQRLARAAQLGCDLATASVIPGGISHRNYERCGFELLYVRLNMVR